jgi:hypothetical protein
MIETTESRRAFEKARGRRLTASGIIKREMRKAMLHDKIDWPFSGQEDLCGRCTEIVKARGLVGGEYERKEMEQCRGTATGIP